MPVSYTISESEFYMWRAVFAFAMADRTMGPEQLDLLNAYRNGIAFSAEQLEVLRDDFLYPHNVEELYKGISEPAHRLRFCTMVRALAWCDGDISLQDARILKQVACLGGCDDTKMLANSAADPELQGYYDLYAKNGLMNFSNPPHLLQVRA